MEQGITIIYGLGEFGVNTLCHMEEGLRTTTFIDESEKKKFLFCPVSFSSNDDTGKQFSPSYSEIDHHKIFPIYLGYGKIEQRVDQILHSSDLEEKEDVNLSKIAALIRNMEFKEPARKVLDFRITGKLVYYNCLKLFQENYKKLKEKLPSENNTPVNIYIVGALGDAFASGVFWEIARYWREERKEGKIFGSFQLPDFANKNDLRHEKENAYAALLELDHFEEHRDNPAFGVKAESREFTHSHLPIFNRVYLFSHCEDCTGVAQSLLRTTIPEIKDRINSYPHLLQTRDLFSVLECINYDLEKFDETIETRFKNSYSEIVNTTLRSKDNQTIACTIISNAIGFDEGKPEYSNKIVEQIMGSITSSIMENDVKNIYKTNIEALKEIFLLPDALRMKKEDFNKKIKKTYKTLHLATEKDETISQGFILQFDEVYLESFVNKNNQSKTFSLYDNEKFSQSLEKFINQSWQNYPIMMELESILKSLCEKHNELRVQFISDTAVLNENLSNTINKISGLIEMKQELKPEDKAVMWTILKFLMEKSFKELNDFFVNPDEKIKKAYKASFNKNLKIYLLEKVIDTLYDSYADLNKTYMPLQDMLLNLEEKKEFTPDESEIARKSEIIESGLPDFILKIKGKNNNGFAGGIGALKRSVFPKEDSYGFDWKLHEYFIPSKDWKGNKQQKINQLDRSLQNAKNELLNNKVEIVQDLLEICEENKSNEVLVNDSDNLTKKRLKSSVRHSASGALKDFFFLRSMLTERPFFLQKNINPRIPVFIGNGSLEKNIDEQQVFLGIPPRFRTNTFNVNGEDCLGPLFRSVGSELGGHIYEIKVGADSFFVLREVINRSATFINGINEGFKAFNNFSYKPLLLVFNINEEIPWKHFDSRRINFNHICGNPDCWEDITSLDPEEVICPHCNEPIKSRCGNKGCRSFERELTKEEIDSKHCIYCKKFLRTYWWTCSEHKLDLSADKGYCYLCLAEKGSKKKALRHRAAGIIVCDGCLNTKEDSRFVIPQSLTRFYRDGVNGHDKPIFFREAKKHLHDLFFCPKCNRQIIPVFFPPWQTPNTNYPNLKDLLKEEKRKRKGMLNVVELDEKNFHMVFRYKGHKNCSNTDMKDLFISARFPEAKFYRCGECDYPIPIDPHGEHSEICPRCETKLTYCRSCTESTHQLTKENTVEDPSLHVKFCTLCHFPQDEVGLQNLGEFILDRWKSRTSELDRLYACTNIYDCSAGASFHTDVMKTPLKNEKVDIAECSICKDDILTPNKMAVRAAAVKSCPCCSYIFHCLIQKRVLDISLKEHTKGKSRSNDEGFNEIQAKTISHNYDEGLKQFVVNLPNLFPENEDVNKKSVNCGCCGFSLAGLQKVIEQWKAINVRLTGHDKDNDNTEIQIIEIFFKTMAILVMKQKSSAAASEWFEEVYKKLDEQDKQRIMSQLSHYDMRDLIVTQHSSNGSKMQEVRFKLSRRLDEMYSILNKQYLILPLERKNLIRN